jgi:formyl-CoA transferase
MTVVRRGGTSAAFRVAAEKSLCYAAIAEKNSMEAVSLPLDDLRVLDLTHARAGPTAVRQLADWGAYVLRIEAPGGRSQVAAERRHGSDFQNLHRNKQAMTLDLKQEEGRAVFLRLVATFDVLVENFRPAVKRRLRIDPAALAEVNPRLVYASVSGFGQDGPYGDRPGVDQIAQGMGGLMSVTGLPGAFGILVALWERRRSGKGQWVTTSLLESQIAFLDFQAARYLVEGEVPAQEGNHHPTLAPMGAFAAADRMINLAASSRAQFLALCEALGCEQLGADPRFATLEQRSLHRDELNRSIAERIREGPAAEWIEKLNERGIPCGPVNDIAETFADPQVRHLGMAATVEHPTLGRLPLVDQPVKLSRTPHRLRSSAPEKGEHTASVLRDLGYSDLEIARLKERGIV